MKGSSEPFFNLYRWSRYPQRRKQAKGKTENEMKRKFENKLSQKARAAVDNIFGDNLASVHKLKDYERKNIK